MARPDAYPRAKALVREAKIENPDLRATAAMEMLEALSELEWRQANAGAKLTDESVGFPLIVPGSVKTISRWIADVPKSEKWNARSSSPAEFQIIARVFRELYGSGVLKRPMTQAEADNIAWIESITPGKPPLTLLALARVLIGLEGNEEKMDTFTSWLVFSVENSIDRKNYPARPWLSHHARLPGVAKNTPNLFMDVYRLMEENEIMRERSDYDTT